MQAPPKVSVVIPTYNGARFIERTVLSALRQTYPHREIIVVDDGSTDDTPKILEKFKNDIICIRTPNGGVARAMNTGVLRAQGEWISFLDHDDLWFKNKMETKVKLSECYPQAGMICCDFIFRNNFTRRLGRNYGGYWKIFLNEKNEEIYVQDAFGLMLKGCVMGTCSAVMVRRDLIVESGLFNPSHRISGDYDCWLRCAARLPVLFLNRVLAYKRTHKENLSTRIEALFEYKDIVGNIASAFPERLAPPKLRRVYDIERAKIDYIIGNTYYESSRPFKAFEHYFKGLGCSLSAWNILTFSWIFSKKFVRLLSLGILSRKRFGMR